MELTQLRYFTEVARTQHMTKSAKRLHVAQPALSQSIHRLEDELGVRLFERQGRNICLTEEGKRFQARVSPLIASLDDAVEETRREASDQLPVVRVGIFSASSLVVDAIASFMAEEPEVAFEVVQHKSASSAWRAHAASGACAIRSVPDKASSHASCSIAIAPLWSGR